MVEWVDLNTRKVEYPKSRWRHASKYLISACAVAHLCLCLVLLMLLLICAGALSCLCCCSSVLGRAHVDVLVVRRVEGARTLSFTSEDVNLVLGFNKAKYADTQPTVFPSTPHVCIPAYARVPRPDATVLEYDAEKNQHLVLEKNSQKKTWSALSIACFQACRVVGAVLVLWLARECVLNTQVLSIQIACLTSPPFALGWI